MKTSEIEELEQIDESLLCMILECPYTVPREMLYLELGVVPLRYIIMSRRIMFYHSMIREPDTSLLYRFYRDQSANPSTIGA